MWNYNENYKKWVLKDDYLIKSDFDYLKQELSKTRFYSKALSGSTYVDIDNVDNLFDVLGSWKPKNWYISTLGSKYSVTTKPLYNPVAIDADSQYDFYVRNIKEYGLTLKNLFTPNRLIKDKLKSFIDADLATTDVINIDLISDNYYIDGVRLIEGNTVLVKNQVTTITLSSSINPDEYFKGPYTEVVNNYTDITYIYYNEENGLYEYSNKRLVKKSDLNDYNLCYNLSVFIKSGIRNSNKQFHLKRLLNGYYPTSYLNDPMEFEENHNWILRNRVDYNNLFETNYYDMLKHGTQSIYVNSTTYSIPERILTVGEFGVIVNTQYGLSSIIPNKWKSNLRSISHSRLYYWICGDDNTFLRVDKTDFSIKSIKLSGYNAYKCISFNESFGVIVGDYNVIFYTDNGGNTWNRLKFDYFNSYSFNKVLIRNNNKFYVSGRGGIFIEFTRDMNGWKSYKREISKKIDDDDDIVLVDHINDMTFCNISNWGLNYSYSTQSISNNKDIIMMVGDDNKFIIYDENDFVSNDFIYLDFNYNYGNIKNISQQTGTSSFFFSNDNGVYKFDLTDFKYLGIGNSYSNVSKISTEIIKPKSVDNGLIFNLDASNSTSYPGSGINWNDLSTSAIAGTLSGVVSYSSLNGGYLSFNNLGSYYQTNNNFNRVETMSWNIWFNRSVGVNSHNIIFSHYLPYLSFRGTAASGVENKFLFSFYTKNNGVITQQALYSNNSYLNNVWYNVCCTLHINTSTGNVTARMFVNGLLENEAYYPSSSNELYNTSYKLLLASWTTTQHPFSGSISSLKIYNKILSADEVLQNYNSDKLKYYDDSVITNGPKLVFDKYVNKVYNNGNNLYLSGNYALIKSSTHSLSYSFNDVDNSFMDKLHSKLLFMDYDMGSKLNFFTDEGDYRLPNSIGIPESFFSSTGAVLSFDNLKYKTNDGKEVKELTWYDYWIDREKTFEFYSEKTSTVFTNKKFYYTSRNISVSIDSIGSSLNLMPNIKNQTSRYYKNTSDPSIKVLNYDSKGVEITETTNQLHLYGYLMVLVLVNKLTTLDVRVGDVLKMESSVVSGNFIVNRIVDNNSTANRYVYMYSEFNDNIINNLKKLKSGDIKFTNLNLFKDRDSFISNFNNHSLGIAYNANYSSNNGVVNINPKFNNLTSYYNLSTSVNCISSGYNEFVKSNINYRVLRFSGTLQKINCISNIKEIKEISVSINFLNSLSSVNNFFTINLIGPNNKIYNICNNFNFTNTNKFSVNFSSLSTVGLVASPVQTTFYKMSGANNIGITGYKSNETNILNLLLDNSSRGDWKLIVTSDNNNINIYLTDWKISFKGVINEEMRYTNSFMKFGYNPTYNILDYLSGINTPGLNPIFHPEKEYLSLPVYNDIPIFYYENISLMVNYDDYVYVDRLAKTNKLYFGFNVKFEWDSIFIHTFIDIKIYQPDGDINSFSNRLLVLKKYYDETKRLYVIEFNNPIKFDFSKKFEGSVIDIISRRKLVQISQDLQELNNIQRPLSRSSSTNNISFTNYDSFLNYKISTDSYTKALLNDLDTVKNLTGIIYTDYKNEIAMNVNRLDKTYKIPIKNTIDSNGSLYIECSEKHDLSMGDGVLLEFNGGTYSSEYLNQQYFGYQVVDKIFNDYGFTVKLNYGNNVYVGNDTGYVTYVKKDPFFNYQPVDLIDLNENKKIKQSIQIYPENIQVSGSTWSLANLDYSKLRFKLVDGLTFEDLNNTYQWLLEAEISDAVIGINGNGIVWYKGIWEFGRWFGGTWYSGVWNFGDWYGGDWLSKRVIDEKLSITIDNKSVSADYSVWQNGRWYGGNWNNGTWQNGRWYGGVWNSGLWNNGIWNDGEWNDGYFRGGIWVDGKWFGGYFNSDNEPSYWLDGDWKSGDFENGMWYNGSFDQNYGSVSRFGTRSSNSRNATWHGGNFKSGSFYSKIGKSIVSDSHKYSIWRTGNWLGGDWFGGIAYNINFNGGTWHGGILEDIQIIGLNDDNSFTLNGIFRFNIGDTIKVLGDINGKFTEFGDSNNPKEYTITDFEVDDINKLTKIYVDYNIDLKNYKGFKSEVYNFDITSYSDYSIGKLKLKTYNTNILTLTLHVDLEVVSTDKYLNNVLINLKSSNGKIINVKYNNTGANNIYLRNTKFTTNSTVDIKNSTNPVYSDFYKFSNNATVGTNDYVSNTIVINDLFVDLKDDFWEVYIKRYNKTDLKINSIKLEISKSGEIGAQLYNPITNGFDTGLRVVSEFNNSNWKSGIWSNGIFNGGLYEGGIWYDGIFNGKWI